MENDRNEFTKKLDKSKLVDEVNGSQSEQLEKVTSKKLEEKTYDRVEEEENASYTYFDEKSLIEKYY